MGVRRWRHVVLLWATVVVAAVTVAWVVVGVFFDSYQVTETAMRPAFESGHRVLARSIEGGEVSRGDVVILRAPASSRSPGADQIMRVVAVAGDRVAADGGVLTVNGRPADEDYLAAGTRTDDIPASVVPRAHLYVLGDDRANAEDSRAYGPVPYASVRALVVVRWWPLSEFGGV